MKGFDRAQKQAMDRMKVEAKMSFEPDILYEDNHHLVVLKPPYLLSQKIDG